MAEAAAPAPAGEGSADFGTSLAGGVLTPAPACLVLGNFDGVHLGHQEILGAARREADRLRLPVVAVTFEPHPRTVLEPALDFRLLSPLELRRRLLSEAGVDRIWVVPFDERLRQLTPEQFMAMLASRWRPVSMVVGPSFSIGRGAEGRLDFLQSYAARRRFDVEVVASRAVDGEVVSSSAARARLRAGDLEGVRRLLGRPFEVVGEVVHGEGLGRQLGFPTANLRLARRQALPPDGVYAMELTTEAGHSHPGVGSIGMRPHFGGTSRSFEVHCLGPEPGDLYQQLVRVRVRSWLRPQLAFATDEELVEQMGRDAAASSTYLGAAGRAS